MKTYQVNLNGRQYGMLEKMLCSYRASQLARNQCINGYELFSDMLDDISSPVTNGWSTYEIVIQESVDKLNLLKFMTRVVFPEDEDHFVSRLGGNFNAKKTLNLQLL